MIEYYQFKDALTETTHKVINFRATLIVVCTLIVVYILIRLLSRISGYIAKTIIKVTDETKLSDKMVAFKRVETWIDVGMAVAKIIIVVVAFYVAWRLISPSSAPLAFIGASAFFVVLAGGTIGPLLRDYTVGSMMIAEKWYGVGDFIKIMPYSNVQGVVEQLTLRATKLRDLNGEVIWVHNQNIQGVSVKYRGATTVAIDVFVKDKEKALKLLEGVIDIVPKGPMLVIDGLVISDVEQLNDKMWRIELMGRTVPGREWLLEKFTVEAIADADEHAPDNQKIILYGPLARYVDSSAERRFKRIIK